MDPLLLFGFVFLSLALSYFQIRQRQSYAFMNVAVLVFYVLLIASRSIDGSADTPLYVDEYKSISLLQIYTPNTIDTVYRYEYGYTLFSQLIKFIFGNDTTVFFGIIALLQTICVYFGFRNFLEMFHKDRRVTLLFLPFLTIYMAVAGFMYNGIVLRAGIAISLQFLATSLILKRQYVAGIFLLGISLFFHNTAFIGLLALLILFFHKKYSFKVYYWYLAAFLGLYIMKVHVWLSSLTSSSLIVLLSSNNDQTTSKLSNYLSNSSESASSYSIFIFLNFLLSALAIRYADLSKDIVQRLIKINLFSTGFLALMSAIPIVSRVFDYFIIFNVALFYMCFIQKYTIYRGIVFFVLVVALLFRFYQLALEPYKFYLNE